LFFSSEQIYSNLLRVEWAKIMFTNAEIVQIQKYPQVYLAKPDNA